VSRLLLRFAVAALSTGAIVSGFLRFAPGPVLFHLGVHEPWRYHFALAAIFIGSLALLACAAAPAAAARIARFLAVPRSLAP
jgi:hypothetical protein